MSESAASALDLNGATEAFATMLTPQEPVEKEDIGNAAEEGGEAELELEPEAEAEESEEPKIFTIKVDGKDVEVSMEDLAEAYKSGLRQDDYTKKTMAVAEERKAAETERQQVAQERAVYAQKLHEQHVLVQALLHEQNQINWTELAENDPAEFIKQKHLYDQRQAAAQRIQGEHQQLVQQHKAQQDQAQSQYITQQREELIAKLPDWSDPEKAKAETSAISDYLAKAGFSPQEIDSIVDHRHVLVSRKAMLYDQMVSKAKAAAKKVQTLPTKVEKPGVTDNGAPDQRTRHFQSLKKSGKIEDAARVFADFL